MPYIRMPYTVQLDNTLRVTPISTLFAMGDSNAHRFELKILREGVQESLAGCTVSGKFYRISENAAVDLEGTVEDGKAVVVLNKSCYDHIGRFTLTVTVKDGEDETTVFYGDGYMYGHRTDTVITGEYIIYDINMLLQKIAEIDAATSAANEAAQNANTASGDATTAADTANTAAVSANSAAGRADAAAAAIEGITATATTLETGEQATAAVQVVDGRYVLALGLPRGLTGATPQIAFEVATGAPGTDASAVVTGTPEAPHLLLTIPRGDVGEIGNLKVNGKTPGGDGSVEIGIDDIDGLRVAIDNAGGVKTVAGVSPDEAGNVALTAGDVGAMQWSLLWENASPTSAFAAQVLPGTYTWTGYDMLMIVYVYDVTSTARAEYKLAQIVECASGMKSYLQMYSVSGGLMFARAVYLNDDGTIEMSGAQKRAFSSITTVTYDNKGCVPLRIYGAMGVQHT